MSDKIYVTLPANCIETHKTQEGKDFYKAYFPEGFEIAGVDVGGKYVSPKFVNPSQFFAGCKTFSFLASDEKNVWVREDAIGEDGKRNGTLPVSDELKFTPAQLGEASKAYEEANREFIRIPVKEFEGGNKNIEKRVTKDEQKREFYSIQAPFNQPKDFTLKGLSWTAPAASGPKEFDGVECYHVQSLKGAEILLKDRNGENTVAVPVASLNGAYWSDFKHVADAAAKQVAEAGVHTHENRAQEEVAQDAPGAAEKAPERTDAPHIAPGTYNPQYESPDGRAR